MNEVEKENPMFYGMTGEDILAALERARRAVDSLEYQVDDSRWPLPKYREMLFIY